MKYIIKDMRALCELETFEINGIKADYDDFGDKYDTEPEQAEPYGCGNMQFVPRSSTKDVLEKYKITEDEYEEICSALGCLSFGSCGWCV